MATKIFVMTHKKYDEVNDPAYISLQVGAASNGRIEGYLWDDDGEDNISAKNYLYGELTGIYWLWKHYHDADNIGICHYRRLFMDEAGLLFLESDYERILSEYDIIVPTPGNAPVTVGEYYERCHNIEDLMTVRRAIAKICPEYLDTFDMILSGKESSGANMMIIRHDFFDEYCKWLFAILFEAEKTIDVSTYDDYHRRVYGFLSEILLNVWYRHKGLKVYGSDVKITGEKAETKELKRKLAKLVVEKRYSEARNVYFDCMQRRPDVALVHSDLKDEIHGMEVVLYILEKENECGIRGFDTATDELEVLVEQYKRIENILHALETGTADENMIEYLLGAGLSDIAKDAILKFSRKIEHPELVRQIMR